MTTPPTDSAETRKPFLERRPRPIVPILAERAVAGIGGPAPTPHLTYHQGHLLSTVQVFTIFWGSAWGKDQSGLATELNQFFDVMLCSALIDVLGEYSVEGQAIGPGNRIGTITITDSEPGGTTKQIDDAHIQSALKGWIKNRTIPASTDNTLYFVYLPPGVTSTLDGGSSCSDYCGYHSSTDGIFYAVEPFITCDGCDFGGSSTLDNLTKVSSHELSEAITNPAATFDATNGGWWDDNLAAANQPPEIGDICNTNTQRLGGYFIQTEWSNRAGACTMPPNWWRCWFLIHPEIKMRPGATVTALWRSNQTHLDLFASGTDGAVWSTWWEAGPGWQPWFLIHPEVKMQPGTPLSAVWRSNDTHLDLFATGTDGAVWSAWWEAGPGWQPWFSIHPEHKMVPGSPVTALWAPRQPDHLDLFTSSGDGTIWSTWWEGTPGWQPWFPIHPQVKARSGAQVTALWRGQHLDLFMTGTDGAVWSTWWEAGPGWQPWFLIHPEVKMQPGTTVSAVWRSNETHLDLFATGTDGAVWSTWWEAGPGWQPWFLIHPEVKMQPGAPVSALWRSNQTHLDLFATGTDGAVWSTWWEGGPGWQSWFLIRSQIKMQPGTTVSAVWRTNQTHLDLFATGTDGAVWSTWWEF